jgi:hypothetical protein
MLKEHDRVVLTVDYPDYDLEAGDVGTVVHIYGNHSAYEIEFFALNGRTLDVVTVESDHVRPISHRDVLHVRERSA